MLKIYKITIIFILFLNCLLSRCQSFIYATSVEEMNFVVVDSIYKSFPCGYCNPNLLARRKNEQSFINIKYCTPDILFEQNNQDIRLSPGSYFVLKFDLKQLAPNEFLNNLVVEICSDSESNNSLLTYFIQKDNTYVEQQKLSIAQSVGYKTVINNIYRLHSIINSSTLYAKFYVDNNMDNNYLKIKNIYITKSKIEDSLNVSQLDELEKKIINNSAIKITFDNVLYSFDSYELTDDAKQNLFKVTKILSNLSDISIQVRAHTDSIGDPNYNINLSQKRAKSVYDYLVSHGIDENIITYMGFGSTIPIAPNISEENRKKNRRSEIWIIKN